MVVLSGDDILGASAWSAAESLKADVVALVVRIGVGSIDGAALAVRQAPAPS